MKRMVALFAAAATALAILFSGCGRAPASGPASAYEKLWSVDIGQEGFARTGASRVVDRQGGDVRLTLQIAPGAFRQAPAPDMETLRAGGREYRAGDSAVCWDGQDENGNWAGGTQYSRSLLWEQNARAFSLFAETFKDGISLDIASPKTAAILEKNPLAGLAGFEIESDIWWVEFGNGNVTASITLYPPRHNENSIRSILGEGGFLLKEEDGMEYYSRGGGSKADDPFVSSMLWRTNMGVFCLSAGVPWIYRNDVPEDALEFIHPELAKSITEQMGGKIIPFGETR